MKTTLFLILGLFTFLLSSGQSTYSLGDKIEDFSLKNIDATMVSLADFEDVDGYVIIFTCNHCPYAKAYEDRMIELHNTYGKQYPIVAISPNDSIQYPSDSYSAMQLRAKEKNFPFVYLLDESQDLAKRFDAKKTPHVYLLDDKMTIQYIGAIDDNWQDENSVSKTYLADAIEALQDNKTPEPAITKAIGCSIKWKAN